MLKARTRWEIENSSQEGWDELRDELSLSSLSLNLLWNRGYRNKETIEEFLRADMSQVHDPFLLDGMDKAVDRINIAIKNKEKILIFGDYDADGVSSTSIMIYTLKALHADFGWYIPNRFTEGYGPNIPALETAKREGAGLVITVDTGIAAVSEIKAANEMGLDVIVTDHHEPLPVLPEAYSIINPKKPGCSYPFKELAGAGVAFKLSQALTGSFPEHLLDLFTLGTVSDLVPLLDENRVLVKKGLLKLSSSEKPGIKALIDICGASGEVLDEDHVGFSMGPRMNAAGRMDAADPAVHLLMAETKEEAEEYATVINNLNRTRQQVVNQITEEALEEVKNDHPPQDNKVIIVGKEGWNPGVIGIVASRLSDRFYRPVIVLSIDSEKGEAKGSARSIEGFNMFEELSKNRDILPHFGGHPMAAGLTMNPNDIEELRERLLKQADEVLSEEALVPLTYVDADIPLEDVSLQALEEMKYLAPFGIGNPKPIFLLRDVQVASKRKIGSEKNHFKAEWERNGARLDCVGFYLGFLDDKLAEQTTASVLGELAINEWNGYRKPQLFLKDIAVKEWQLFDKRQHKKMDSYIEQLPEENTLVLTFNEKTYKHLASYHKDKDIWLFSSGTERLNCGRDLVLSDLPSSLDELQEAISSIEDIERVHVFFEADEQVYFQPTPSRDDFKWYYAFLKKRTTFNISKHGEELAKWRGWLPSTLTLLTSVFLDLNFVKMKDGNISIVDSPSKQDLTESPSFQKHIQQKRTEQELLYSTYAQLKETLDLIIIGDYYKQKVKEKVGHEL